MERGVWGKRCGRKRCRGRVEELSVGCKGIRDEYVRNVQGECVRGGV